MFLQIHILNYHMTRIVEHQFQNSLKAHEYKRT